MRNTKLYRNKTNNIEQDDTLEQSETPIREEIKNIV